MYKEFKREAPRWQPNIRSDLEILALAQHHELPTRLLDWSTNPLVAAWFACENENAITAGAIHMVRIPPRTVIRDDVEPFDPALTDVQFVRVPASVARITAQQGLFSLHPDPSSAWEPDKSGYEYEKLTIPNDDKPFFREMLYVLGHDKSRLMTDLDGLCGTLAWNYRANRA